MSNAEISNRTPAGTGKRKAVIGRDSLNMPNLVTATRLLLSLVLFSMISAGGWWISAAALFVFAASTDALDGYLARRYQQITVLGRILDPFVDKVIVCGSFVFLLEKQGAEDSGVNAWMVIIIIGREMFVSSLRGILEKEGKDFSASMAGKMKMTLQCVAVTVSLLSLSESLNWPWLPAIRDLSLWIAVGVTIWSGMIYVVRGFSQLRA
ncbi:MAG: CDP-diacylglycerol--glycerol-3-phosphate 3-phosphatidyltransferase [Planctomycetaceae bacterium]|nr:CDP-diacylglycerol--glycerol-3-phosphate 3-phosphatidyltransferase [Planctomycetaceae bacterium]